MDAERTKEVKRAKRRVPPDKRKRAAQSCERCKRKRIRCERPDGGNPPAASSSDRLTCTACAQSGSDCIVANVKGARLEFGNLFASGHGPGPSASSALDRLQRRLQSAQQHQSQCHDQQQLENGHSSITDLHSLFTDQSALPIAFEDDQQAFSTVADLSEAADVSLLGIMATDHTVNPDTTVEGEGSHTSLRAPVSGPSSVSDPRNTGRSSLAVSESHSVQQHSHERGGPTPPMAYVSSTPACMGFQIHPRPLT